MVPEDVLSQIQQLLECDRGQLDRFAAFVVRYPVMFNQIHLHGCGLSVSVGELANAGAPPVEFKAFGSSEAKVTLELAP